jgi:hypothetical protein
MLVMVAEAEGNNRDSDDNKTWRWLTMASGTQGTLS